MNLIGESLTAGSTAYSPWFEACGDGVVFAIDVMQASISTGNDEWLTQIQIDVQAKHLDDDDAAAVFLDRVDAAPPWKQVNVGVSTARYNELLELVRFKYTVSFVAAPGPTEAGVHFRMLPPMWQGNCLDCTVEKELSGDVEATF